MRPAARQKFALVVVDFHALLDGQGRRRHIDDFVKPFLRGFGEVKRRAASERDGGCAAQRNRAKAQHAARFDRQCRAHLVGGGNMERHARLDDDARGKRDGRGESDRAGTRQIKGAVLRAVGQGAGERERGVVRQGDGERLADGERVRAHDC